MNKNRSMLAACLAVSLVGCSQEPPHSVAAEAAPAAAAPAGVAVEDAWIRLPPPGAQVAAGYLVLRNPGAAADRLVSARSSSAERVEIHEMRMEGEMMRMRELADGVPVPAGGEVRLEPGGLHLMFMQPVADLSPGERVDVVLVFENAGERQVAFDLRHPDGSAAGHGHGETGMDAHDAH